MSRRSGIYLVGLLMAGCGSQPLQEPRTVPVQVTVLVPCRVVAVETPAWAISSLKPSDNLQTKVRALLAERLQRIGYEKKLEAAIQACQ